MNGAPPRSTAPPPRPHCDSPHAAGRKAAGQLDSERANGTIPYRPFEKMIPMAITAVPSDFRADIHLPTDHLPLLRWMIFTGVCLFGFVLAWHFGLVRMMLNSDKTYISVIILVLYVAASLHCWCAPWRSPANSTGLTACSHS
jgi:hypothetical protein